jgi:hypothetical protein
MAFAGVPVDAAASVTVLGKEDVGRVGGDGVVLLRLLVVDGFVLLGELVVVIVTVTDSICVLVRVDGVGGTSEVVEMAILVLMLVTVGAG